MFGELKNEVLAELNSERSFNFFFVDSRRELSTVRRVVCFKPRIKVVKRVFKRGNAESFKKQCFWNIEKELDIESSI